MFCPDGGPNEDVAIQVSSTNLTVTGVSDWNAVQLAASSWDHLWNGQNVGIETTSTGPQIGAHTNKGITFDLDAIEAARGGQVRRFTAAAAIGTRPFDGESVMSFLVYVDGALRFEQRMEPGPSSSFPLSVAIAPQERFLTLITAATGDIQDDWAYWDAPTLTIE